MEDLWTLYLTLDKHMRLNPQWKARNPPLWTCGFCTGDHPD